MLSVFLVAGLLWPVALNAHGGLAIAEQNEPEAAYEGVPVSGWIERLNNGDSSVRCTAATALGKIGRRAEKAVPALIKALRDKNGGVQENAAWAIGRIGKPAEEGIPSLLQMLKNDDAYLRIQAAYALGRICRSNYGQVARGVKTIVGPLAHALKDIDSRVRRQAAAALVDIGPEAKEAATALVAALDDEDRATRGLAARAAGQLGKEAKSAIPRLTELLADKSAEVRESAAFALGLFTTDAKGALQQLQPLTNDPHVSVRVEAAIALWSIDRRTEGLLPVMIAGLEAPGLFPRRKAVAMLTHVNAKEKSVILALEKLLKNENALVRVEDALALWRLDRQVESVAPILVKEWLDRTEVEDEYDSQSISLAVFGFLAANPKAVARDLSRALADSKERVRFLAANALGQLRGHARFATPALVLALRDESRRVRFEAACGLANCGPEQARLAIPVLMDELKSKEPKELPDRYFAAVALAEIGRPCKDVLGVLLQILKEERDESVRGHLIDAIGLIGPEAQAAVPQLNTIMENTDDNLRVAAALALLRIDPKNENILSFLISSLNSQPLRHAAAYTLGETGSPAKAAIPALTRLLTSGDIDLTKSAAKSLGRMGPAAQEALTELKKHLTSENCGLRVEAAIAIARVQAPGPEIVTTLTKALDDADTCRQAMAALSSLGPSAKPCVPRLVKALWDNDDHVRKAAADALSIIDPATAAQHGVK
jgi:HEAT repeat protein